MSSFLFHFFTVFLLIQLQSIHCHSKDFQSISMNIQQTFPLSYPNSLDFQIQKTSSSAIGTYRVSVVSIAPESASTVALVRKGCRDGVPAHDMSFESNFPAQDKFGIFFDGDSSQDNCFSLRLVDDVAPGVKNFTIEVTFTPLIVDVTLKLDESQEFKMEEKEQKVFAFYTKDLQANIIQITANASSNSTTGQKLQLNAVNGECIVSSSKSSWLCYLSHPEDIFKFTILNQFEADQYEIKIAPIQLEQTIYNYQGIDTHLIPGFGALYMVELPAAGILKVMAKGNNGNYLPITAASSLAWLFSEAAPQTGNEVLLPKDHIHTNRVANENFVIIKNSYAYTQWFYFVREEKAEMIEIYSYFIKQDLLEVDVDTQYYIDPEVYEYQHVELKLGAKDFITKYEVTLKAGQESLMNIYYSTDLYYNTSFLFPDNNFNIKKASLDPVSERELVLPLFIVAHDTSVYLTIHGLTKGFYTISVREIEYPNIQQGILIVILISCISAVIYLFFALIYNLRKSTEFYDFDQSAFPREEPQATNHTEIDIEANIPQAPVEEAVELHSRSQRRTLPPNIVRIIRILKKKVRAERAKMMESQRQDRSVDSDSTQDKSDVTEDNMCDICYERKKTIAFGPCGHACSCDYCAIKIIKTAPKCPLCRAQIEEIRLNEVSDDDKEKVNDSV